MKRPLVAVVLAGGSGSRFWPLTTDKLLFPFLGKRLIETTVCGVLPDAVTNVVVIANPENAKELGTLTYGAPHTVVVQNAARGMADALLTAKAELRDAALLVLIADHYVDRQMVADVVKTGKATGAFGVLPGWKPGKYFPGGYFRLEGKRITGITEKPEKGSEPSGYVNISGHFISDANVLVSELERVSVDTDDQYEQALTNLMGHAEFRMLPYEGPSAAVKYPWDVLQMMETLLGHKLKPHKGKGVEIRQNVFIDGPVYIGDNVRIFENTKIVGPVYIGDNTIIGNNNIIRDSMLGSGCITGFNTDITRSYIGDNCWFHSNYVGDSVLEGNISMGSGAALANLRLDEGEIQSVVKGEKLPSGRHKLGAVIGRHVRIGVNASVMPGVKLGRHTMIGAGVIVDRDVPEKQFVLVKQERTVLENTIDMSTVDRDEFKRRIS